MPTGDYDAAMQPDRGADEAAIRALVERQVSSWNRCDPTGYAAAYTEDGDCVSFLGIHYPGRDAIAASQNTTQRPTAEKLARKLLT